MRKKMRAAGASAALAMIATAGAANATPDGAGAFQQQCAMCHALDATPGKFGPPLRGVVGRKAGSAAGYAYSDALKALGIRWTPHALEEFLEAPSHFAPGARMTASVPDRESRAAIVAYLKSQSPGPRSAAASRKGIRR